MRWEQTLRQAATGAATPPLPNGAAIPSVISARDLQSTSFPPVSWLVPNLIPEGLTLLAGKPKLGKSWLALQLAYGVASGGEVLGRNVDQGAVLYAALEDNQRRLKARLQKSTPPFAAWPETLSFATEWPRLDAGGLDGLERWISEHARARLIIIDTLATVRPGGSAKDSQYQSDYAALRGLHALANEAGLSIVVVHHVRKADADDPFDTVSGSTGLTGAADTTLILKATTDGTVLYGRGRDLSEVELAVSFDPTTCVWTDLGRPADVHGSETRKAIRAALKAGEITPKGISDHTGLDYDLSAKTLQRMLDDGEVQKGGRGNYRLTPDPMS